MVDQIPKIQPEPSEPSPEAQEAIEKATKSSKPRRFTFKFSFKKRWLKVLLIVLGILAVLSTLIAFPAVKTLRAAQSTMDLAKLTYEAGKNQNLPEFNQKLETTKQELIKTHKIYKILSILSESLPGR